MFSRRKIIGISRDFFHTIIDYPKFHTYFKTIKQNPPQKVIYTCITGGYDCLLPNISLNPEYKYVCFTENPFYLRRKNVGPWQIEPLYFNKLDNTRNNRWHKMHPHILFPEYETSIFIDANVLAKTPKLFELANKVPQNVFLSVPPHRRCSCIYDEIEACIKVQKDDIKKLEQQRELLLAEGFPKKMGMTENNVIFRRHNHPLCIKIMEEWWNMLEHYSKRDQLSLFYVLWKNNVSMHYLSDISIKEDKKNFRIYHHNKR